jgi:peptidoglycan/LPS O-acetylase OafA/YrhL
VACAIAAAALFTWRRGFGEVDSVIGSVGLSVFAVGFAAAIGVALTSPSRSALRRFLSATPLVALGTYSYGLYVFHQPLILGLRDLGLDATVVPRLWGSQAPGVLAFGVIAVALSITCAVVSWHLWEQPFLRLKRYLPYHPPSVSRVQPLASPRTDSLPV